MDVLKILEFNLEGVRAGKSGIKVTYWKVEPILLPFSGTPGSGHTSPARPL